MKKKFLVAIISLFSLSCIIIPTVAFSQDGLVIECALKRPGEETGYCNDVNDLVEQAIDIANFLLGIAGSIALLMFIYGGFMFLTAMGRAEQAKKAKNVIGAAVLGLIISFSAFLLIDFLVAGLGVSSYFTG